MDRIKKLGLFTLVSIVIIASTGKTEAVLPTVVKLEPYQNVAGFGQQFAVKVTIAEVQDLFGLELDVLWNASILQLISSSAMLGVESHPNGVLHGNSSSTLYEEENIASNKYVLIGTSIGQQTPSFSGSGTLVELSFNVTGIGSCDLNVQATLYNKAPVGESATQIDHSTESGFFSSVYTYVSPSDVVAGQNVTIGGYVVPDLENVNVTIQYRQLNELDWLTLGSTATDNQGNYTYQWKPQQTGTYQIQCAAIFQNVQEESAIVSISVRSGTDFWPYVYTVLGAVLIVIILSAIYILKTRGRQRTSTKRS